MSRPDTALRHLLFFTLPAAPLRYAAAACSSSEPGDAATPAGFRLPAVHAVGSTPSVGRIPMRL
eukprot:11280702-Heterocapsa_arctica.AAC.1